MSTEGSGGHALARGHPVLDLLHQLVEDGSLALLRSSVNAMHTDEQIDGAIAAICRVGVRLGIIASAQVKQPAKMAEKLALPAE